MTPETWKRIQDLVASAMALPPGDRPAYLAQHCADGALRTEIEDYLRASTADTTTASHVDPEAQGQGRLPRRFRVIRRLGGGGFGDVFQVFDDQNQSEVALKVLRDPKAHGLYQFKQEFRTLAAVRHRHLVRLHELITDHGDWMFTMELIAGDHFTRRVHRQTDHGFIRRAFAQLVDGVAALHAAGFLHRDLKPSNVLVGAENRVVVVDFGLVRELHPIDPNRTSIAGTPAYMAPEQTTLAPLTEAADWYAVGVILYEVLTGRLPFAGDGLDAGEKKRSCDPVPPSQLVTDLPADLEEICLGLLRRVPDQRLSGREARARLRLDEAGDRAFRAHETPPAAPGGFVGRERELAIGQDTFLRVAAGEPQTLHVIGSSGIGKSALVQELIARIRHQEPGVVVLAGRCHQTESVPYQGIDEVVDALSRHLRKLTAAETEQMLPRHFSMLAHVFPVLEPLGATAPHRHDVVDPTEFRTRVFLALREMIGRISDRRPVVVVIDDVQWADLDAVACLRELLAPPAAPAVLLVLAYRSDDVDSNLALRSFLDWSRQSAGTSAAPVIALSGLDARDARMLVMSMLAAPDGYPSELVSAIVAEADGSPFLAHELVQGLVTAGSDSTGEATAISVQRAVVQRLDELTEVERTYVELVAVAGYPTPARVIDTAAVLPSGWLLRNDLSVKRLLRIVGRSEAQTVEIYHARIREVVLSLLPESRQGAYHARLAAAFEQVAGEDPERLAFHYERAGEAEVAAAYALKAARRAMTALAFNQAARGYRQALRLGRETDQARRTTCAELGDALTNAGRGPEAAEAYLRAAELSTDADTLQLRSRAAGQFLRSGHLREGVALLEAVLSQAGISVPQARGLLLLRVVMERLLILLATWRSSRMPIGANVRRNFDEVDVCGAAALGFSMVDPIRCAFYSARFVRLACAAGEPYRACLALAGEATQVCHTPSGGSPDRAAALLAQAHDLAERIDRPHARGFVKAMGSTVAYLQGQWGRASAESDEALEILQTECTGVAWELCTAHTIGFIARCARGEWAENGRRLPGLIREAQARGDRFAHHSLRVLGCAYVLDLAADDPEKARRDLNEDIAAWSYKHYDIQRAAGAVALVDIALYEGDAERAVREMTAEWPLIVRSKLLRLPTTFTFSYASRGRAAIDLAARLDQDSARARALLADATNCATRLLRQGPPWARGVATLLLAGVDSCRGHSGGAKARLIEAEMALTAANLVPLLMAARWRLASLDEGGRSAALSASVAVWTSTEGIRKPENALRALAPGRW